MDLTFEEFKNKAKKILNLNLDGYKIKRVKRRTNSLMKRKKLGKYSVCLNKLKEDDIFRNNYINHLTINTSEFFRNPEIFEYLEKKILPEILKSRKKIKIWSAPCSDGSEPYSIALILKKMQIENKKIKILASDINSKILETANKAVYKKKDIKNVPAELKTRYFNRKNQQRGNDKFQLDGEIKKMVNFEKKDLLNEDLNDQWDLIVSRNFFIYLTKKMKVKIVKRFVNSLTENGYLLLGNTEFIFNPKKYNLKKENLSFYKKINNDD